MPNNSNDNATPEKLILRALYGVNAIESDIASILHSLPDGYDPHPLSDAEIKVWQKATAVAFRKVLDVINADLLRDYINSRSAVAQFMATVTPIIPDHTQNMIRKLDEIFPLVMGQLEQNPGDFDLRWICSQDQFRQQVKSLLVETLLRMEEDFSSVITEDYVKLAVRVRLGQLENNEVVGVDDNGFAVRWGKFSNSLFITNERMPEWTSKESHRRSAKLHLFNQQQDASQVTVHDIESVLNEHSDVLVNPNGLSIPQLAIMIYSLMSDEEKSRIVLAGKSCSGGEVESKECVSEEIFRHLLSVEAIWIPQSELRPVF